MSSFQIPMQSRVAAALALAIGISGSPAKARLTNQGSANSAAIEAAASVPGTAHPSSRGRMTRATAWRYNGPAPTAATTRRPKTTHFELMRC